MIYGILLNKPHCPSANISKENLAKKGYRIVPNHSFSNFRPLNQWITEWKDRKRFHLCQFGKEYFLHLDYFENNEHKTEVNLTPEIKREILRLNS